MIKNRVTVEWHSLPVLYRDAWEQFPFDTAEEAQEFLNLAGSRVRYLASRAPDGKDKVVGEKWNAEMYEELVSNHSAL